MRVLIVYENIGTGHRRAAQLIQQMLETAGGSEVCSVAASDLVPLKSAVFLCSLWEQLIEADWVRTADFLVNKLTRIFYFPLGELQQMQRVIDAVAAYRPDLVVSTCNAWNKCLSVACERLGIPFLLFHIELTPHLDVIDPKSVMSCYVKETAELMRRFPLDSTYFRTRDLTGLRLGEKLRFIARCYAQHVLFPGRYPIGLRFDARQRPLNGLRVEALGPFSGPDHPMPRQLARAGHDLPIEPDHPVVSVVSGGIGGAFLERVVRQLARIDQRRLNILALCGRSKKSLADMNALRRAVPHHNLVPLEFRSDFSRILALSDVVVLRPSASVFMESTLARAPMVMPALVTSNDLGALWLVENFQLGEVYRAEREIPEKVLNCLAHSERYASGFARFLNGQPHGFAVAAEKLCSLVRELTVEAAAPTPDRCFSHRRE